MAKPEVIKEKIKKLQRELKEAEKKEKEQLVAQQGQFFTLLSKGFSDVLGVPFTQIDWKSYFEHFAKTDEQVLQGFILDQPLSAKETVNSLKEVKNICRLDQAMPESREILGG